MKAMTKINLLFEESEEIAALCYRHRIFSILNFLNACRDLLYCCEAIEELAKSKGSDINSSLTYLAEVSYRVKEKIDYFNREEVEEV